MVDFTHSWSPFFQAVFAPRAMSVESDADLDGKTIYALKNRLNEIILKAKKIGGIDKLSKKWRGRAAGALPL